MRLAVRDGASEVVDEVAAKDVPLARPVPSRVDRPRVARLENDVVDVVVRNQMLVAAVEDRAVRRVMDAAADDRIAAAVQRHARRIDALEASEIIDLAINDPVVAVRQRPPVASVHVDAAASDGADRAVRDRHVAAVAADDESLSLDARDRAVRDQDVLAGVKLKSVAAAEGEGLAADDLVRAIVEIKEGGLPVDEAERSIRRVGRRNEVESFRRAVNEPFAGGIEELARVDGVVAALLRAP